MWILGGGLQGCFSGQNGAGRKKGCFRQSHAENGLSFLLCDYPFLFTEGRLEKNLGLKSKMVKSLGWLGLCGAREMSGKNQCFHFEIILSLNFTFKIICVGT